MCAAHGVHVSKFENIVGFVKFSKGKIYVQSDNKENNSNDLPSTLYIDKWSNIYVHFIIDVIIELSACFLYFSIHMTSAFFYVGMCFYLGAMKTDLKLQLQVIHGRVDDLDIFDSRDIDRNLLHEINLHGRLYE